MVFEAALAASDATDNFHVVSD